MCEALDIPPEISELLAESGALPGILPCLFLYRFAIPSGKRLELGFKIEESELEFQNPAMAKTELGFSAGN